MRAEREGRVLARSGDTGPCAALGRLGADADLFLCEADIDAHREGEQVHLTPGGRRPRARAAAASRLLVTHVGPTLTRESATKWAAAVFGDRTATAREARPPPSERSAPQAQLPLSEALTKHAPPPTFNASYFVRHI